MKPVAIRVAPTSNLQVIRMSKQFNVAVVGATGAVGEVMLSILAERKFPVGQIHALASERSAGGVVKFGDEEIIVRDLATFDPTGVDIALFSAGGSISKEYGPKFAAAGAVVIDNSSAFRYDDDVPLVVSEVNPEAAKQRPRGIIANPNCSTMQMVVALGPIHRKVGIVRINVATYQSVSGGGRSAMEELGRQTAALLSFKDPDPKRFPVQIAFNLIPHIDDFQDNGYTKEEMKLVWETRKILGDDNIQVNPTAVRVPVFYGHSEAVNVETREKISAEEVRALLSTAPGVEVVDERVPGGYPTPVTHASGRDAVYVGRIREDFSHPRAFNLWIVSDNIRKGAALNAVQIAELVAAEV
jgi:aspartate-semialdehyde dehydrogenase